MRNVSKPVDETLECQIVQGLLPRQRLSIGIAQGRLVADRLPVRHDDCDLLLCDRQGALLGEEKLVGSSEAQRQLAATLAAVDLHGLRGSVIGPRLWAGVVGRGEREKLAVPEGGIVWLRARSSVLPTRMLRVMRAKSS